MIDLEQLINEKNAADEQWRAKRQAERENVTELQDVEVTAITTTPEAYAHYLNMQADNFSYSSGNVALVMIQMPEATVFGTQERWRSMGRFVLDSEQAEGVSIFARSPNGKGYSITNAYDITQTSGKEMKPQLQLKDGTKEMGEALKILMNYSTVPTTVNRELPVPAYYDQQRMTLFINPQYSNSESFAAIATEVAHSRFHQKGFNGDYLRAESDLDAQSISYILCRRFGVNRDLPDLSGLSELYQGWTIEGRKSILDGIQDMSKNIGRSIEKSITPLQRTIPQARRPTRHPPR